MKCECGFFRHKLALRLKVDRVDRSFTGGHVLTMAPYEQFIEGDMTDLSLIGWSTNKLPPSLSETR